MADTVVTSKRSPGKLGFTSLDHSYWKDRLPRAFKFYLDRLARGFVRVQPSNGHAFAMVLMEDLLSRRNEELAKLPEVSYLSKLKVKVENRSCLCGEPLPEPKEELAETESLVSSCKSCGRTSRQLQTPEPEAVLPVDSNRGQEEGKTSAGLPSRTSEPGSKPRVQTYSQEVQTGEPAFDQGVQVNFGLDQATQVSHSYPSRPPGSLQYPESIIIFSPLPDQAFRPPPLPAVKQPGADARPRPPRQPGGSVCAGCLAHAAEDHAMADLMSEGGVHDIFKGSAGQGSPPAACFTPQEVRQPSPQRPPQPPQRPQVPMTYTCMTQVDFGVNEETQFPRSDVLPASDVCPSCLVSDVEKHAREELKAENKGWDSGRGTPGGRSPPPPRQQFVQSNVCPGCFASDVEKHALTELEAESWVCDTGMTSPGHKTPLSTRPPVTDTHMTQVNLGNEVATQAALGSTQYEPREKAAVKPEYAELDMCPICGKKKGGRGTPSPSPISGYSSPVRMPSPVPYEILSPLPGQDSRPVQGPPPAYTEQPKQKPQLGKEEATQVNLGHYMFIPFEQSTVKPGFAQVEKCPTCGKKKGGRSPRSPSSRSSTPTRQPSPDPYQILSPMPGQKSKPAPGPRSPKSQKTEPVHMDICPTCGKKKTGKATPSLRPSPTPSPTPQARKPSPEPYEILSPMPGQGSRPAPSRQSEPPKQKAEPVDREACPECGRKKPDRATPSPVPKSPLVIHPCPEPYEILSPMPVKGSVAACGRIKPDRATSSLTPMSPSARSSPVRLPSPEAYVIISPMQGQGFQPVSPHPPATQSQGRPSQKEGQSMCGNCVAFEVEKTAIAELKSENPAFSTCVTCDIERISAKNALVEKSKSEPFSPCAGVGFKPISDPLVSATPVPVNQQKTKYTQGPKSDVCSTCLALAVEEKALDELSAAGEPGYQQERQGTGTPMSDVCGTWFAFTVEDKVFDELSATNKPGYQQDIQEPKCTICGTCMASAVEDRAFDELNKETPVQCQNNNTQPRETKPSTEARSSVVRRPSPEPYRILSPMPGQVSERQPGPAVVKSAAGAGKTLPSSSRATPIRHPSPEHYVILSPMSNVKETCPACGGFDSAAAAPGSDSAPGSYSSPKDQLASSANAQQISPPVKDYSPAASPAVSRGVQYGQYGGPWVPPSDPHPGLRDELVMMNEPSYQPGQSPYMVPPLQPARCPYCSMGQFAAMSPPPCCCHCPEFHQPPCCALRSDDIQRFYAFPPPSPPVPASMAQPQQHKQHAVSQTSGTASPNICAICSVREGKGPSDEVQQTGFASPVRTTAEGVAQEQAEDKAIQKLTEYCILGALSALDPSSVDSASVRGVVPAGQEPACECGKDYTDLSDLPDNLSRAVSPDFDAHALAPPINVNVSVEVDSNFDSNLFMQQVKEQITEAMDKVIVCQKEALEFQRQCLRSDQQMLRDLQEAANPMVCSAADDRVGVTSPTKEVSTPFSQASTPSSSRPEPGSCQERMGKRREKRCTVEQDAEVVIKDSWLMPESLAWSSTLSQDLQYLSGPPSSKANGNPVAMENPFQQWNKREHSLSVSENGHQLRRGWSDSAVGAETLSWPLSYGSEYVSKIKSSGNKIAHSSLSYSSHDALSVAQVGKRAKPGMNQFRNYRCVTNNGISVAHQLLKRKIPNKHRHCVKKIISSIDKCIIQKGLSLAVHDWVLDWMLGYFVQRQCPALIRKGRGHSSCRPMSRSRFCPGCFVREQLSCGGDSSPRATDCQKNQSDATTTSPAGHSEVSSAMDITSVLEVQEPGIHRQHGVKPEEDEHLTGCSPTPSPVGTAAFDTTSVGDFMVGSSKYTAPCADPFQHGHSFPPQPCHLHDSSKREPVRVSVSLLDYPRSRREEFTSPESGQQMVSRLSLSVGHPEVPQLCAGDVMADWGSCLPSVHVHQGKWAKEWDTQADRITTRSNRLIPFNDKQSDIQELLLNKVSRQYEGCEYLWASDDDSVHMESLGDPGQDSQTDRVSQLVTSLKQSKVFFQQIRNMSITDLCNGTSHTEFEHLNDIPSVMLCDQMCEVYCSKWKHNAGKRSKKRAFSFDPMTMDRVSEDTFLNNVPLEECEKCSIKTYKEDIFLPWQSVAVEDCGICSLTPNKDLQTVSDRHFHKSADSIAAYVKDYALQTVDCHIAKRNEMSSTLRSLNNCQPQNTVAFVEDILLEVLQKTFDVIEGFLTMDPGKTVDPGETDKCMQMAEHFVFAQRNTLSSVSGHFRKTTQDAYLPTQSLCSLFKGDIAQCAEASTDQTETNACNLATVNPLLDKLFVHNGQCLCGKTEQQKRTAYDRTCEMVFEKKRLHDFKWPLDKMLFWEPDISVVLRSGTVLDRTSVFTSVIDHRAHRYPLTSYSQCSASGGVVMENNVILTKLGKSPLLIGYPIIGDFNRTLFFYSALFKLHSDISLPAAQCICVLMLKAFAVESKRKIKGSEDLLHRSLSAVSEQTPSDWMKENSWNPEDGCLYGGLEHTPFPFGDFTICTEAERTESNTNASARTNSPVWPEDSEQSADPTPVHSTVPDGDMKTGSSDADHPNESSQSAVPVVYKTKGYDGFQYSSSHHWFEIQGSTSSQVKESHDQDRLVGKQNKENSSPNSSHLPALSKHIVSVGSQHPPFSPNLCSVKNWSSSQQTRRRCRSVSPKRKPVCWKLQQEDWRKAHHLSACFSPQDSLQSYTDGLEDDPDLSAGSSSTITQSQASLAIEHGSVGDSDTNVVISSSDNLDPAEEQARKQQELSELSDFVFLERAVQKDCLQQGAAFDCPHLEPNTDKLRRQQHLSELEDFIALEKSVEQKKGLTECQKQEANTELEQQQEFSRSEEELQQQQKNESNSQETDQQPNILNQSLWHLDSIPEEDEYYEQQDVPKHTQFVDTGMLDEGQGQRKLRQGQFSPLITSVRNRKDRDVTATFHHLNDLEVKPVLDIEMPCNVNTERTDVMITEPGRTSHACRHSRHLEQDMELLENRSPAVPFKLSAPQKGVALSYVPNVIAANQVCAANYQTPIPNNAPVMSSSDISTEQSRRLINLSQRCLDKMKVWCHLSSSTKEKTALLPNTTSMDVTVGKNSLPDSHFELGNKRRASADSVVAMGSLLNQAGTECCSKVSASAPDLPDSGMGKCSILQCRSDVDSGKPVKYKKLSPERDSILVSSVASLKDESTAQPPFQWEQKGTKEAATVVATVAVKPRDTPAKQTSRRLSRSKETRASHLRDISSVSAVCSNRPPISSVSSRGAPSMPSAQVKSECIESGATKPCTKDTALSKLYEPLSTIKAFASRKWKKCPISDESVAAGYIVRIKNSLLPNGTSSAQDAKVKQSVTEEKDVRDGGQVTQNKVQQENIDVADRNVRDPQPVKQSVIEEADGRDSGQVTQNKLLLDNMDISDKHVKNDASSSSNLNSSMNRAPSTPSSSEVNVELALERSIAPDNEKRLRFDSTPIVYPPESFRSSSVTSDSSETFRHTLNGGLLETWKTSLSTSNRKISQDWKRPAVIVNRRRLETKETSAFAFDRVTIQTKKTSPQIGYRGALQIKNTSQYASHRRTLEIKTTSPRPPNRGTLKTNNPSPLPSARGEIETKKLSPLPSNTETLDTKKTSPLSSNRDVLDTKKTSPPPSNREVSDTKKTSLLPSNREVSDTKKTSLLPSNREVLDTKKTCLLPSNREVSDTKKTSLLPSNREVSDTKKTSLLPSNREVLDTKKTSLLPSNREVSDTKKTSLLPSNREVSDTKKTSLLPSNREVSDTKKTCLLPSNREVLDTKKTCLLPSNREVLDTKKTSPLSSNKETLETKKTAPLPFHRGTVETKKISPLPSNRGTLETKKISPLPSNRGTLETKKISPLPSNRGILETKKISPLPSNRGTLETKKISPLPSNRGILETKKTSPLPSHRETLDTKKTFPFASKIKTFNAKKGDVQKPSLHTVRYCSHVMESPASKSSDWLPTEQVSQYEEPPVQVIRSKSGKFVNRSPERSSETESQSVISKCAKAAEEVAHLELDDNIEPSRYRPISDTDRVQQSNKKSVKGVQTKTPHAAPFGKVISAAPLTAGVWESEESVSEEGTSDSSLSSSGVSVDDERFWSNCQVVSLGQVDCGWTERQNDEHIKDSPKHQAVGPQNTRETTRCHEHEQSICKEHAHPACLQSSSSVDNDSCTKLFFNALLAVVSKELSSGEGSDNCTKSLHSSQRRVHSAAARRVSAGDRNARSDGVHTRKGQPHKSQSETGCTDSQQEAVIVQKEVSPSIDYQRETSCPQYACSLQTSCVHDKACHQHLSHPETDACACISTSSCLTDLHQSCQQFQATPEQGSIASPFHKEVDPSTGSSSVSAYRYHQTQVPSSLKSPEQPLSESFCNQGSHSVLEGLETPKDGKRRRSLLPKFFATYRANVALSKINSRLNRREI